MTRRNQSWPNLKWEVIGAWPGGTVTALALSPHFSADGFALAGTLAGLFQLGDGGQRWQHAGSGMADPQITSVILLATGATLTAFAATQSGYLYQSQIPSTSQHFSWQPVTGWAGFGMIQALVASPNYDQDQTLFAATNEGVFRSHDGGNSWESSTFGLLDLDILCLACAPTYGESELLWAGSAGGGLYRSRNGARSWRDSGMGLPDSAFQCLLVSPDYVNDQTLFVGTERDGIYISTDGSATWAPLSADLAGLSINCMARSAAGQQWIAGASEGLHYSHDGGQCWETATRNDGSAEVFMALAVTLGNDGCALAGTVLDGIIRSDDGGAGWTLANNGLAAHAPPLTGLTAAQQLVALDGDGLLAMLVETGPEDGVSWQLLNRIFNDEAITTIATTSGPGGALLVTTATDLYWLSADNDSWQSAPLPSAIDQVTLLSVSSDFIEDHTLLLGDSNGLLQRSTDSGHTWQQLTVPWQDATLLHLHCSPFHRHDQLLYAVTATVPAIDDPAGPLALTVWQGQAGGDTWEALADLQSERAAIALALPRDPAEQPILLAMQNRLIKLYQAPIDPIAEQPPRYGWTVAQQFLPATVRITGIVTTAHYLEDRTVYLTTTQGIYSGHDTGGAATDSAEEWQQAWPEIADQTIVSLHCTKIGQPLYAVSLGGTIWRASQSDYL